MAPCPEPSATFCHFNHLSGDVQRKNGEHRNGWRGLESDHLSTELQPLIAAESRNGGMHNDFSYSNIHARSAINVHAEMRTLADFDF